MASQHCKLATEKPYTSFQMSLLTGRGRQFLTVNNKHCSVTQLLQAVSHCSCYLLVHYNNEMV